MPKLSAKQIKELDKFAKFKNWELLALANLYRLGETNG
jgi:hypothetical protein